MKQGYAFLSFWQWLTKFPGYDYVVNQSVQPIIDAVPDFPLQTRWITDSNIVCANNATTTTNYTVPAGKHRLYLGMFCRETVAKLAGDSAFVSVIPVGVGPTRTIFICTGLTPTRWPVIRCGVVEGGVVFPGATDKPVYQKAGDILSVVVNRAVGADQNLNIFAEYYELPMEQPFPGFLF